MFGDVNYVVFLIAVLICVSECKFTRKERSVKDKSDGKSSLAFVFDVTGSMYNDLRQVREGAEMILNTALEDSDIIADFVFVPFHDPKVGPATVTRKKDIFKKALNIVRVYGGGDCPEMSLTGIQMALNVSRPGSFLYVFTDATAVDHRKVGKVLDTIQRKQSQVVFILTGHCNDLDKPSYKVYQQVAAASSGQIFNLNKTSVHKMLEFVKSSIKGRTVNLASVSNPAGYNYTQEIPVDSTLGEVTVSVSGAKPHITVVDPKGEHITGPPKLITTLDLAEIMVVKVMQPEPGNWLITVGSEEEHSVKVVGLSNLTFSHGFSVVKPQSMLETSYRPLKGTYNFLMISLTQTNVTAGIKYAEVLTLDGQTIFELPLTEVDSANKVYLAEPFVPPEDFFYIAINGRDQYNQELRRIGATAIQAKSPDVPYLTAPQQVEAQAHSRVVLTCEVESLVPVNVMWTKDATRIQQQMSTLQSTSMDFVIEDMKEEHVGTYRCTARNIAGTSSTHTELIIIVAPPQVTIEPENVTVEAGDKVTITCTVYSEALLLQNRLEFKGTDTSYAIDIMKEPNLEALYTYNKTIQINEKETGIYSCIAANRGGKTNQSTQISIKVNPTAQILGPHTLSKLINTDLQLVCAVDNALVVVWTAPDGNEVKRIEVNGTNNDAFEVKDVKSDGVWTCTALRGTRKASDSVEVTVLIKPVVSIEGAKNITVLNGTVVEVVCIVEAKPTPRILWHRETEEFLDNTITEIKPTVYRSVLTLDSSSGPIDGTYVCLGENSEGTHQDSIVVDVRRKMTLVQGFTDLSVQLYNQIELQCIVDAYPPAVTHWYHNGTALVMSSNVHVTEDNTTVYLKRVDFSDLGDYTCEAENEYEKIEVKGTITVEGLASPMLSKEPTSVMARAGGSTKIPCRILQGNPEPVISWQYKTDESTEYTPLPKEVVVNDRFELTISNVREEHGGIYRCVANNVIGQDSYDVNLVVQYPPKLVKVTNEDDKPQEVKLGDKVKLSCEATGLPPPVTVWTKDGRPLVFTDKISLNNTSDLVIEDVSAYNSGTYTCNVTSTLGSTHKNFTLNVYDPPKILSVSDPILELSQGQLVELPCTAQGIPAPTIHWTKSGEPVGSEKHINEYGLRFVAKLADFGEYTCTATNVYGDNSFTYILHVWVPPYIVPPKLRTNEVLVGSDVRIQCDVIGLPVPTVQWMFDKQLLKENTTDLKILQGIPKPEHKNESTESTTEHIVVTHHRFELTISNVRKEHGGLYRCVASNVVGKDSYETSMVVQSPPKLVEVTKEEDDKPREVKLGDKVKLSCEATGLPPPVTVWTKDGRPVVFTDKLSLTNTSDLIIEDVSAYNSGTYTCNVTSTLGSTHKNFTLNVYDPPKILSTSDRILELLEGQLVELPCTAQGIPAPSVQWTQNGEPVGSEKHIDEHGLRFVANLTDFGEYTCTATNVYGDNSVTYTLHVWVPPYIVPPTQLTKEVLVGSEVTIQCDVIGFPVPTVQWMFDKQLLKENTTDIKFNDVGNIYISNVSFHHEGQYVCVAENLGGFAEQPVYLKVNEPPKVIEDNYTGPYLATNVDTVLSIACHATGKPKPYVMWVKDEFYLNKDPRYSIDSDGTLHIHTPSEDMSGNYTCIVRNSVGQVNKTVPVEIYSIPTPAQSDEALTTVTFVEGSDANIECPVRATSQSLKWKLVAICEDYAKVHGLVYNVSKSNIMVFGAGGGRCPKNIPPVMLNGTPLTRVFQFKYLGHVLTSDMKDNDDIERERRALSNAELISVGPLHLPNVTRDNTSTYSCVATNMVGSAHGKVQLIVEWAPQFVKEESRDIVRVRGDDCYFHCDVDAKPGAKTKWVFNSKPLVFEDKSYLKVINVQLHNSGTYKCIVSNIHGTVVKEFTLKVLEPPFISDFDMMDVQLKEGDNATLECNAKGSPTPTVTWTYNNTHWLVTNTSLSAVHITPQYEGLYRCDAVNGAGATHIVYRVAVIFAPKIQEITAFVDEEGATVGNVLEVEQGSNIRIACKASGNPVPDIQWLKQGRAVSENRYDIDYADLVLNRVEASNAGVYTCVANNEGGSSQRVVKLDVLEPPKIFQTLFDTTNSREIHLEVILGQSFYLHCHPYGNPMPEVYWFKNEVPLKLFDDTMVSTDFGEVIVVKRALEEQTGNYTCVMRNKVGNTSLTYLVDVLVPPPTPKESVKKVTAKFGKQLTLVCPSEGTRPNVMWIKHPYTEINGDDRTLLTDANFTLIIKETEVSDSGKYSCILTNKVGTTEITFDVVIQKKPTIAGNVGANIVEGHVVPMRRSIVLKCEADGHPMPQISWLKDTQELSKSASNIQRVLGNSLLAIWSAEPRDAGQYICLVENQAGTAHRRYNIAIQVPGKWSPWSAWSLCNVTCGLGHQTRERTCYYTDDQNNTIDSSTEKLILDESSCKGPADDRRKCHMPPCEVDESKPRWSQWSRWSECSATCGAGTQARTRRCKTKAKCPGDNVQIRKCAELPSCNTGPYTGGNDVFDGKEDITDNDPYLPEMTFEMQPEAINSHYSSDVEEFYSSSGSESSTVFYDVLVTENLDGSDRGPCDPGYRHNVTSSFCDDVDECMVETNQCHLTQVCVNTAGAYRCSCSPGYLSLGAGQRCIDINECELETDGCEYSCVNTAGGYVCACPKHLRLHLDRHHCVTPSLYRRPYGQLEVEYLSTTIDFPTKYTPKTIRQT